MPTASYNVPTWRQISSRRQQGRDARTGTTNGTSAQVHHHQTAQVLHHLPIPSPSSPAPAPPTLGAASSRPESTCTAAAGRCGWKTRRACWVLARRCRCGRHPRRRPHRCRSRPQALPAGPEPALGGGQVEFRASEQQQAGQGMARSTCSSLCMQRGRDASATAPACLLRVDVWQQRTCRRLVHARVQHLLPVLGNLLQFIWKVRRRGGAAGKNRRQGAAAAAAAAAAGVTAAGGPSHAPCSRDQRPRSSRHQRETLRNAGSAARGRGEPGPQPRPGLRSSQIAGAPDALLDETLAVLIAFKQNRTPARSAALFHCPRNSLFAVVLMCAMRPAN